MADGQVLEIFGLRIPVEYITTAFLAIAPITSYADQMFYVWRRKSSDGFTVDTCLLLLLVAMIRLFYRIGRPLELPILLQSASMFVVQLFVLKFTLVYQPDAWSASTGRPSYKEPFRRPFRFWQWTSHIKYYMFLAGCAGLLALGHLFFHSFDTYFAIIARVAVALEAIIPLPQLLLIHNRRSLSGFRFTLLFAWVSSDAVKFIQFCTDGSDGFYKIGAGIQTLLDFGITAQYCYYRKDHILALPSKIRAFVVRVLARRGAATVKEADAADAPTETAPLIV
ncbi:uncharacterized protein V1510DRAFT_412482 [Dipodascopsis tothii]|uniref:uncharacterized protein n=1 Tax=Dipodascopsis tothii TaxID=44089 RepID=UPI0034CF5CE7